MNDPKRLIEVHPSSRVRRGLRAGVDLAPPPRAERAVWAALNASLAVSAAAATAKATTAVAGAGSSAATASASATGAVAGTSAGAGLVGVGLTTIFASAVVGLGAGLLVLAPISHGDGGAARPIPAAVGAPSGAAARPASAPRRSVEPAPARTVSAPVEHRPRSSPAPSARPGPPAPAATITAPTLDESSQVLAARRELSAGNPARAREILERGSAAVPVGGLDQERAALEIEALVRLGDHAEAERMARTFLGRYPDSPHAARVRALVKSR